VARIYVLYSTGGNDFVYGWPTLMLGEPIDSDGAGALELLDLLLPAIAKPTPAPAAIAAITIHFVLLLLCADRPGEALLMETEGSGFGVRPGSLDGRVIEADCSGCVMVFASVC
jgi:hypothetical protein